MEATLAKPQTSKPRSPDTSNSDKGKLISEWVVRFALNADKPLNAKEQTVYCSTWEEGFSDVDSGRLKVAFIACLRSHTFKTIPTIGDIRQHLQKAEGKADKEEAAQKWTHVLEYIRLYWNPDMPPKHAPRITERTRRAINAAGGLAYIADCELEEKQWARKRFVEQYIRYGELQEEQQFLLPEGKLKNLLADAARPKALPAPSVSFADLHKRGLKYAEELVNDPSQHPDLKRAIRELTLPPSPHSLEEQKRILREKGFLPELRPAEASACEA